MSIITQRTADSFTPLHVSLGTHLGHSVNIIQNPEAPDTYPLSSAGEAIVVVVVSASSVPHWRPSPSSTVDSSLILLERKEGWIRSYSKFEE